MFAYKFKQLRLKRQLTQKQLAEKLCISQSTIAFYESGKKHPTIDNLKRIAIFFDVSAAYFFSGYTPANAPYAAASDNPSCDFLHETNEIMDFELTLNTYRFSHKGKSLTKKDITQLLLFADFLLYEKTKKEQT